MAKLEDLIKAKDEVSARLLRKKEAIAGILPRGGRAAGRTLHAIGVGRKIVDGKRTNALCVRFYVLHKVAAGIVPRAALLPKRVAGLPTDVIESPLPGFHSCLAFRRRRLRPFVGGISAAHATATRAATLGSFCRSTSRRDRGDQFVLGCSHSFANLGNAPTGSAILQPSPADGGGTTARDDRIARFWRSVPIVTGLGGSNRVDAAIARVTVPVLPRICRIGTVSGTVSATDGMIVRKTGRSTGYTEGEVTDVSLDPWVMNYDDGSLAVFLNQHRIEPTLGYPAPDDEIELDGAFAAPGDSGSLIVEKTSQRAVGLHFAGAYGIGIANPIVAVCLLLQIAF